MILVVAFLLLVVSVPLAGGDLRALADVRVRHPWALAAALGIQVLILVVVPGGSPPAHRAAHLLSYGLAGFFVVANRAVPGLWVLALGGGLNALVIALNGGVMPARPEALETAGLAADPDRFSNSAAVASPKLSFLGDIFAVPESWPFATVFSIGDLVLLVGAAVALHRICGSRLPRLLPHRQTAPSAARRWGTCREHRPSPR